MAAGALAACVSRTLVAPFERVKMECILRQREFHLRVLQDNQILVEREAAACMLCDIATFK